MKKLIFIFTLSVLCFGFSRQVFAQVDTAGVVFVSNDYRLATSDAIVVKWLANKVYYPNGFDVYRQEVGQSDWLKLNKTAIQVKKQVPLQLELKDTDTKTLLNYVLDMKYEDFQKNLVRVFVAIKAVEQPLFAEVLGIIYYDESAQKGKSYRYKVVGNTATSSETIHISKAITSADYFPTSEVKNIVTERKRKSVEINWTVENDRFYGVYIYRKSSTESDFVKITDKIISVTKAPNEAGEMAFPKIFFEDRNIQKDLNYSYKLVPVDYFGQEGTMSKAFDLVAKDFDAPLPPFNVRPDARMFDVTIKWQSENDPDIHGFNIYRRKHFDDAKVRQNVLPLPKTDTVFTQKSEITGGFYYSVSSVDLAGNEAFAPDVFIDVHDLTPPAIPQNVRVTSDTGKVILKWDAVKDADLWGYFIHRSLNDENNLDNEFIVVNTDPILTTEYTEFLPAKVKNKFVYKVVAVDSSYNRSKASELSIIQLPDVTPPLAPFIKNVHTDHQNIKLEWLKYHEEDLAGYHIYRSTDSVTFTQITITLLPPTTITFEDKTPLVGKTYFYYVKAQDVSGNISAPSGIYKAMCDASENGNQKAHHKELALLNLKTKVNKKKATLKMTWKNPVLEQFVGVVVYRGTSSENLKPITGTLKEAGYSDSSLMKGEKYIYQLRSYDNLGHKFESDNIEISLTK